MDLRVRCRYAKPAFALLVSLSVAGTCLAAPALAAGADGKASGSALGILAASADAAREAEETPATESAPAVESAPVQESAPAAETEDAQEGAPVVEIAESDGITVFGGLQLRIPEDYMVTKAAGILLATNEDGSVVINLITPDGSMGAGMLNEVEDVAEFFGAMADEAAADTEATITDKAVITLADGTEAYAYTLEMESDGSQIVMHQFYMPMPNGSFALAQFAYEAGADEATVDLVADIADTLQLAPEGAAGAEAAFNEFEGAGVKLEVADALVLDAATVDTEPTWYSEDGTMMFGLIPQLMEGASLLTDDDYAMLYTEIATSLGGEPWETTTVAANGVDVKLGGFSFEDEGDLYVGILGLVTAADDTLTGIMALMPADQVDVYGPMLDTMYESVSVVA